MSGKITCLSLPAAVLLSWGQLRPPQLTPGIAWGHLIVPTGSEGWKSEMLRNT